MKFNQRLQYKYIYFKWRTTFTMYVFFRLDSLLLNYLFVELESFREDRRFLELFAEVFIWYWNITHSSNLEYTSGFWKWRLSEPFRIRLRRIITHSSSTLFTKLKTPPLVSITWRKFLFPFWFDKLKDSSIKVPIPFVFPDFTTLPH